MAMATSAERMRAWKGLAILTYGFRPFFLGSAVFAALAMAAWIPMLAGRLSLPTAFDPVSWHAHEFLFGYLGAVIAGFLLTAVPNWTGRLPLVGWPLAGLFTLWLSGRIVVAVSAGLPASLVAAVDLAFQVVLAGAILRELVAGRNWRNLVVLAMLALMIAGNLLFHLDAARGEYAAQGSGLRLGLAAAVLMIAVIGGRIVPSFTRNWLVKRGETRLPRPLGRFDKAALLALFVALALWVVMPEGVSTGIALMAAGALHALRLSRWAGARTGAEPLVWILHAGYGFVPAGALALGTAILFPGMLGTAAAQHLWLAGAIGVMTLAVMTRATLGHTGQALAAGPGTALVYLLLICSVLMRVLAGLSPAQAEMLYVLSALTWISAFAGFAVLYGPLLARYRKTV
ncbi:NnrS family protein [Stappia sp.]|uniref:NnrS family protein n=1 Tax=Stappia sp. TaxID=1870903 RepID=UPI003D0A3620